MILLGSTMKNQYACGQRLHTATEPGDCREERETMRRSSTSGSSGLR